MSDVTDEGCQAENCVFCTADVNIGSTCSECGLLAEAALYIDDLDAAVRAYIEWQSCLDDQIRCFCGGEGGYHDIHCLAIA